MNIKKTQKLIQTFERSYTIDLVKNAIYWIAVIQYCVRFGVRGGPIHN